MYKRFHTHDGTIPTWWDSDELYGGLTYIDAKIAELELQQHWPYNFKQRDEMIYCLEAWYSVVFDLYIERLERERHKKTA